MGRRVGARELRKARLDNYRCLRVARERFPAAIPWPRGVVEGLMMDGLTASEAARLIRYEGGHYRVVRRKIRVEGGQGVFALLFESVGTLPLSEEAWTYAAWKRKDKKAFIGELHRWIEA
ncbi:MAG: gamma-glutamylcyclotransferase [Alphaproteobacteria bacterium]|nr:gamma-glutamylcyclotransferase [Alphaproteobacteria bacterium]